MTKITDTPASCDLVVPDDNSAPGLPDDPPDVMPVALSESLESQTAKPTEHLQQVANKPSFRLDYWLALLLRWYNFHCCRALHVVDPHDFDSVGYCYGGDDACGVTKAVSASPSSSS